MSQEFSVTQSLFGLNPDALLRANQAKEELAQEKEAMEFARLSSMQKANYMSRSGGLQMGREGGRAIAGMMGADVQDPNVKLAQATRGILQQLQMEGMDPNDSVSLRKELAKRLSAAGFVQPAAMLAKEVADEELATSKTRAEIAGKYAGAQKDIAIAKNEQTPTQRLLATGKYDPDSVAEYDKTGDPRVLKVTDEKYFTVETADGVYLQSKIDSKDRTRIGDPIPREGSMLAQNRAEWKRELDTLFKDKTRDPEEILEELRRKDPARFANLMAIGKQAVGADNVQAALQAGGELKEAQSKLWGYGVASMEGWDNWQKKWGAGGRKIPNFTKDLQNLITLKASQTVGAGGQRGLTYQAALEMIKDPDAREYLSDSMKVLLPILRKDTGAAIAAEEWRNYFDTYIPMGGINKTDNESRYSALKSRVMASDTELEGDPKLRRLMRNYQAKKEAGSLDPNAVKAKVQALLAQNNDDAEAVLKQLTKAERIVASKWLKEE